MLSRNDEITDETPVSFLTVGQFISVLGRSQKSGQPPVKVKLPEIYGLETVCEQTGYCKATIYGKTSRNEIPHFKRDNKLFFRRDDIVSWMTANPIETVDEFSRKMDDKLTKRRK